MIVVRLTLERAHTFQNVDGCVWYFTGWFLMLEKLTFICISYVEIYVFSSNYRALAHSILQRVQILRVPNFNSIGLWIVTSISFPVSQN